MILIVIGALGSVQKSLVERLEESEIRGRSETIPITELLRSREREGRNRDRTAGER